MNPIAFNRDLVRADASTLMLCLLGYQSHMMNMGLSAADLTYCAIRRIIILKITMYMCEFNE